MKKLILSLVFVASALATFAQSGAQQFSGVFYRVNDSTAYQTAAVAKHSLGYSDIYFNNQATTPHFDVWNGSSYDHIFNFASGGGAALTDGEAINIIGDSINVGGRHYNDINIGHATEGANFKITEGDGSTTQVFEVKKGEAIVASASDGTDFSHLSIGITQILLSTGASHSGIGYSSDLSATIGANDLTQKTYVDNHIAGQDVDNNVTTPTSGEDGYVMSWDETSGSYKLVPDAGGLTEADLTDDRTITGSDDLDQTDNLNIVYTDCAAPCNVTVDLLSAGTQVTVINIGAATATLIEGSGVTLPGTTVDIAPDENAVIIYRVAATPDVWAGSSSGGTVTSASVVSANGFAGSVATATTTPAITLSTTVTGVLKGNGTAISAATNADLPVMTATVGGAVPTPPNNTTTFLRGDGTFAAPTGSGDVTGPASSVDSEVAIFNSTTGKIIKRASGTGIAKLTSGVLSTFTPGTNVETFLTTPTYTNFLAAVTGTSPYYLTASGGAATASNTKTFNTANWDNTTSTWTATANGQFASNETGTLTARATVNDFIFGRTSTRTLVASANGQALTDTYINPTFTLGAFTGVTKVGLHINDGGLFVGPTTLSPAKKFVVKGLGTSSSTLTAEFVDSSGASLLAIADNGLITIKQFANLQFGTAANDYISGTTGSLSFSTQPGSVTNGAYRFRYGGSTATSGVIPVVQVETSGSIAPTSGTADFIGVNVKMIINQTGSASGNLIGFNHDPILTSMLGKNIAVRAVTGRSIFGGTSPTAIVEIGAGTATAGTAPLKLTSGTNLTTPESGAIEFDGTNYFVTSSTTRYTVAKTLTNTATLNFDLTSVNSQDLTITVTGAAAGDAVSCGVDAGSATANVIFTWWVSATNTVTVRASRIDVASGADPASGTFRASVIKY